MKRIHFISGLPRSGSTLLTSILNQNPQFSSDITDPLYHMVKAVRLASQSDVTATHVCPPQKRLEVLLGLVQNYYGSDSRAVCFNTNRGWCSQMPLIHELFPDAKVIAMVRDPVYVLNSFERLHQKNPLVLSLLYDKASVENVYTRTKHLLLPDRPVGLGMRSLDEGLKSLHGHKILLVDYRDDLCTKPTETMKKIHAFIGEPEFAYDFENVEMVRAEYDSALSAPGLHTVRAKVEYKHEPLLLPQNLIEQIK